jgi:hydroxymethylpyrimidine pyrophosphatase-like HAD family hydrolase
MFSKSKNETQYFDENIEINEKYVYLFRSWRTLLNTANVMKNIWIFNFNKQKEEIHKLFNTVKYMDQEELESFEDDLPKFLYSLTEEKLEELIDNIENNLVEKNDAICKMYTIHLFKGLENKIIKIADDIDGDKEENLYYVALTRGSKIIIDN